MFAGDLLIAWHFARLNYEGITSRAGWKATVELERRFRAGAHGLKIAMS
jgi:hypothetical protein